MKKTVILTIGAPGSGKSTWAEQQAKDPKTFIVCRDNLRQMMFGGEYKYSRAKEQAVTAHVKQALEQFLEQDHFETMIIADTNLNETTRNGYKTIVDAKNARIRASGVKMMGVSLVTKTFEVPWIELEKRNQKRGDKAVPKDVLRSMYLKMRKYTESHVQYEPDDQLPKAVIFDLDGTLADNNHRGAFEYEKLVNDTPIEFVKNLAVMYHKQGYRIICVSGRNSGNEQANNKFRELTSQWLIGNNIPFHGLYMRAHNDFRKDDIVKEEIFWEHIAPKYNVEVAVDDRDQVVEMWRRIGVNCLQCNFGEF